MAINVEPLIHLMLQSPMRQFIIEHKGMFEKAIIAYANCLPEVTRRNTIHPNTHLLLDFEERFFGYYTNPQRVPLWRAVFKIAEAEYEHDPEKKYLIDVIFEWVANSNWIPRPLGHPRETWCEPEPYGGGHLIKNKKLGELKGRMDRME